MQDPATILSDLGVELTCAIDPDVPATMDLEHTAFVNYEAFVFSSDAKRRAFEERPLDYLDAVTDPVNHVRFKPSGKSPVIVHAGRPFYFLADSTRTMFAAMPDSFTVPTYRMLPKSAVPALADGDS